MSIVSILEIVEWLWKHIRPAKLLLIVEDNSDDALFLCQELEEQNVKHALARNGEDALALMRWTRFYSALIDLGLPGMSGFMLARKIWERGYKTKILFITGSSFINLEPGQHINIVRKPVTAEGLRAII